MAAPEAEAEAAAETAETAEAAAAQKAPSGNASVALKAVVTNATADKARSSMHRLAAEANTWRAWAWTWLTPLLTGSMTTVEKYTGSTTTVEKRASSLFPKTVAIEAVVEMNTDEEKAAEELKRAEESKAAEELKEADEKAAQGDTKKEKIFAERIAPLAKKITEYIQDHTRMTRRRRNAGAPL